MTTPYPERCLHPRLCWWPDPHVFSALTVCLPWTRPPGGMAFQPAGYCPTSNVRFGVRKCDTSAWYVTYTYQPRLGEWVGPRKLQKGQPQKNCRLYTSGWKLRCLSKPKPGGLCMERPWGT